MEREESKSTTHRVRALFTAKDGYASRESAFCNTLRLRDVRERVFTKQSGYTPRVSAP